MSFLKANDTLSGQEGKAYATINGEREEMFYIKKFEAKVEKEKAEVKTIGRRGSQNKAKGWKGTGTMTIYYVTTLFRQMMLDYIKSGKDTYFDVVIVNEDPNTSVGSQTIMVKGVNLNSVIIAKLDTESEALDEDIDFTFEDFEVKDKFGKPVLG